MIKDSGERTEFTTGAQRDMHAGKGRFDLLPWHAIHDFAKHCEEGAIKYGERNIDKGIPQHSLIDSAIRHLVRYIHNETDEPHLRAAAWNIMWALEQETTHPELIDLPGREESKSDEDICRMCKHNHLYCDEFPCDVCIHGANMDVRDERFEPEEKNGETVGEKISEISDKFLKHISPFMQKFSRAIDEAAERMNLRNQIAALKGNDAEMVLDSYAIELSEITTKSWSEWMCDFKNMLIDGCEVQEIMEYAEGVKGSKKKEVDDND